MIAATAPRNDPRQTRLLRIDRVGATYADGTITDLLEFLSDHDLLVVNDAATLPASLTGVTAASRERVEVRLAGQLDDDSWRAVLFGAGDWRLRTEDRPPPPHVAAGDVIRFDGLVATITTVDAASARLVSLAFDTRGAAFWRALYLAGRPVQYAHLGSPLALSDVQTVYAARPWASEAPSAGLALTLELLRALSPRGVGLARVTHAAGLSSTGEAALDARLPLPERYEIPSDTTRAIDAAKERGARVVAVGTTTMRALEGAAARGKGRAIAGQGITDLRIGPETRRRVVDAIITGVHDASSSHFRLLESFATRALLERSYSFAERRGYRSHEFGDLVLL